MSIDSHFPSFNAESASTVSRFSCLFLKLLPPIVILLTCKLRSVDKFIENII